MMKNNMKSTLKDIKITMKATFGFAPAMKNIIPMESAEKNGIITEMAFCVNGKGYTWALGDSIVYRAEVYDIE